MGYNAYRSKDISYERNNNLSRLYNAEVINMTLDDAIAMKQKEEDQTRYEQYMNDERP